jgi:GTPase
MSKKRKIPFSTADIHPKTLLVGVYVPHNKISIIDHYFDEFLSLVKTLGLQYDDTRFIKLRHVDKNNFLSKGKLEELVEVCNENNIEEVLFSEPLSPLQERNLEDFMECSVFDRQRLILEIFKKSAQTAEGKIQVQMAEINYLKTRLIGKGKEYAQQAGFIGTKGPGETIKEEIRRHFAEKMRQSKKRLETLAKSRNVQRKMRLESKRPIVCLIGYTNAGKSSILNKLTKCNVLEEDKLFATLDTTTREFFIGDRNTILISDTVGFISQLPHALIEAFQSTLDELQYADLLLQIVDISNPAWRDQIIVAKETLDELHVEDKKMIYVFNKIDKLSNEQLEDLEHEIQEFKPNILISTRQKGGIEKLFEFLKGYDFKKN